MSDSPVIKVDKLGSPPWSTEDPFLFCVHHLDHYPEGNEKMGPKAPLSGRKIGMDFSGKDGWSMYHGDVVPGFPQHPHRGFETVTIARQGYIDHTDSLGAHARFGHGDVQWMTVGRGVVHSEMFPLVHTDKPNTTELFQIWLNLPADKKMVDPHFKMFWHEEVPRRRVEDDAGKATEVGVIAGELHGMTPPSPPPESWAASPESHVAIWTLKMEPGARLSLPATNSEAHRTLYFFAGDSIEIAGDSIPVGSGITVKPEMGFEIENGEMEAEILVLQGKPIGHPVAQHGPFVMNSSEQLRQAFIDYQRTQFGGWPWPEQAPTHKREQGRFAVHVDGRREEPDADAKDDSAVTV